MATKLTRAENLKPGDRVVHLMGYEPPNLTVMKVETVTYVTFGKKDAIPIKVAIKYGDAVYVET